MTTQTQRKEFGSFSGSLSVQRLLPALLFGVATYAGCGIEEGLLAEETGVLSSAPSQASAHANGNAKFVRCDTRDLSDAERSTDEAQVAHALASRGGGGGTPPVTGCVVNVYFHVISQG